MYKTIGQNRMSLCPGTREGTIGMCLSIYVTVLSWMTSMNRYLVTC